MRDVARSHEHLFVSDSCLRSTILMEYTGQKAPDGQAFVRESVGAREKNPPRVVVLMRLSLIIYACIVLRRFLALACCDHVSCSV